MVSLSNFDSAHESFVADNDFLAEVILGLRGPVKSLPCKYFYDEVGSKLFDSICESPEYYPTRTELRLMKDAAQEIATAIGSNVDLIEYGSGASKKVRYILDALEIASIPDAHNLLSVIPGIECGRSAKRRAILAMLRLSSPA